MQTEYSLNTGFVEKIQRAAFIDKACEYIMKIFGNPSLTKFEMYQELHRILPPLKHIAHNRVAMTWKFIFNNDIVIEISPQVE